MIFTARNIYWYTGVYPFRESAICSYIPKIMAHPMVGIWAMGPTLVMARFIHCIVFAKANCFRQLSSGRFGNWEWLCLGLETLRIPNVQEQLSGARIYKSILAPSEYESRLAFTLHRPLPGASHHYLQRFLDRRLVFCLRKMEGQHLAL